MYKDSHRASSMHSSDKGAYVQSIFSSVAKRYDVMNDLMSGGLHRLWKDEFVAMIRPRAEMQLLDMAGGTGDVALRCYEQAIAHDARTPEIIVCDPNSEMLREGKDKALNRGITAIDWITCSAEEIPLPDASMTDYTISFGLRNVTDRKRALAEAWRILKPGGGFFCLEFSPLKSRTLFAALYKVYAREVIPRVGQLVARDRSAYEYLIDSIEAFPTQQELRQELVDAGFVDTSVRALAHGLVAIHSGVKA